LSAIALTTNLSTISAVGNDYDFNQIFERQIASLTTKRDVVIGISTSGNSENVLRGISEAKRIGAKTVAFTGNEGGRLNDIKEMAEVAAESQMFGFKSVHEAMAIMLLCQAENLHPAIAMRDFHVIQGRPALKLTLCLHGSSKPVVQSNGRNTQMSESLVLLAIPMVGLLASLGLSIWQRKSGLQARIIGATMLEPCLEQDASLKGLEQSIRLRRWGLHARRSRNFQRKGFP
jgi:hypothetical protein